MARAPKQEEIPGTESPDRDPELHALWLEIVALEEDTRTARAAEKAKREAAGMALHKRGLTEYFVDGAELWIEPKETVKAKKKGGRPKGKVRKVVAAEGGARVEPGIEDRLAAARAEDGE